jgi:hypothetical protein
VFLLSLAPNLFFFSYSKELLSWWHIEKPKSNKINEWGKRRWLDAIKKKGKLHEKKIDFQSNLCTIIK